MTPAAARPLVVTASPHLKGRDSTPRIMWTVVGSLMPNVAAATWFFGRGDLPRWAGYGFGWRIAGRYLACSPDRRPSRLAGVLAADVLLVLDHESGAPVS